MEHIVKTVEGLFRTLDNGDICAKLTRKYLKDEVERTSYKRHMRAVSYIPNREKGRA